MPRYTSSSSYDAVHYMVFSPIQLKLWQIDNIQIDIHSSDKKAELKRD